MKRNKYIICSVFLCICTVMYLLITPWPGVSFTDTKDTPTETAEGYYVAGITNDSGITTYYETLQAAIDAVNGGETIDLLNDTKENINSENRSYTLEMNSHFIDGNENGRVFKISGGTVTLKNGTLTNGYIDDVGGGLNIKNANVTLEGMKITDNRASADGGGIYLEDGVLTVTGSEISFNSANGKSNGGGIYANNSKLKAENTTLSDNNATYQGGGLYSTEKDTSPSVEVELTNVKFLRNTGFSAGAAMYLSRSNNAAVNDCLFDGNQGTKPDESGSSVITVEDDLAFAGNNVSFNRCTVTNNENIEHTIDIQFEDRMGWSSMKVTFNDCVISDNTALRTGGIRMLDMADFELNTVTLNNTVVKNNTAFGTDLGQSLRVVGGVSCTNGSNNSLIFNSGAIYNNTSADGRANDLLVGQTSQVNIIAACDMKDDFAEEKIDFSNYVWRKPDNSFIDGKMTGQYAKPSDADVFLTAYNAVTPPTVSYNDEEFDSIPKAIEAAKVNDDRAAVLTLLFGKDKNGVPTPTITAFYTDNVIVDFPITLDMGQCSLNPRDDALFTVVGEGSLILSGSGRLNGLIDIQNDSDLTLATDTDSALDIRFGNEKSVLVLREDFVRCGDLSIELDETRKNALTTPNKTEDDISYIIAYNVGDKLRDIELTYKGEPLGNIYPLIDILVENNNIIALNPTIQNDLYVGSGGRNDATGASDDPFPTVEAAIDKLLIQQSGGVINLLGTVETNGSTEWDGRGLGITIRRSPELYDVDGAKMINVNSGSLTLKGITIDGGGTRHINSGSLIGVSSGAELILGDGAKLTNNDLVSAFLKKSSDYLPGQNNDYVTYSGGAVFTRGGTVIIEEGSTVSDCNAFLGGGIYCEYGTIIMNGGTFANNTAAGKMTVTYSKRGAHYSGSGGGIAITGSGCHMELSGGTFINNTANVGGAIAIGTGDFSLTDDYSLMSLDLIDRDGFDPNDWTFIMTGGELTQNTAVSNGGGLFVQSSYKAFVERGDFIENTCNGGGNYGGGAIYVNGGKDPVPDGELWLTHVLINGNQAKDYGGGIAGCGTSGTVINAKDGSVIYGNTALCGTGDYIPCDISSSTHAEIINQFDHTKDAQTHDYFTQYMLDGTPYHWRFAADVSTYSRGDLAPEQYLNSDSGKLIYTEATPQPDTENKYIQVRITDNYSGSCGGGIGTNGSVFIGDPYVSQYNYTPPKQFKVTKKWQDESETARPSAVDQINIWVLTVDGGGELLNHIHNPMLYRGKWSDTLAFDIPENGKAVVIEEVVYNDGRHVLSIDGNDKEAYEKAINKFVNDVMQNTPYIWDSDGFSPFTSVFVFDIVSGNFTVTNTLNHGDLTVSKTVTGDHGETEKDFHFTVTLSDTSVNGTYGDMTFQNGVAAFTLKHTESKTAAGLPAGISYEVAEEEAGKDNYTTRSGATKGQIPNSSVEAYFINDRTAPSTSGQGQPSGPPSGQGQVQAPEQERPPEQVPEQAPETPPEQETETSHEQVTGDQFTQDKTDEGEDFNETSGYSPNTGVDLMSFGLMLSVLSLVVVLAVKVFSKKES